MVRVTFRVWVEEGLSLELGLWFHPSFLLGIGLGLEAS